MSLSLMSFPVLVFFFQAEDGIRDYKVTGVQTCALPICRLRLDLGGRLVERLHPRAARRRQCRDAQLDVLRECGRGERQKCGERECGHPQIGRASWRERGEVVEGGGRADAKKELARKSAR